MPDDGRVAGKVAFVTGAARGQGQSHALRLAGEGADIIALDLCGQIGSVSYPMATRAELAETVTAVEQLDRRAVAVEADVRDPDAVQAGWTLRWPGSAGWTSRAPTPGSCPTG